MASARDIAYRRHFVLRLSGDPEPSDGNLVYRLPEITAANNPWKHPLPGTAPYRQGTDCTNQPTPRHTFLMDCREFRAQHIGFVDDTLPAVEMDAMHQHLTVCVRCSRHDTAIRRGLLIVRNLPRVELSPDFMDRLNARLHSLDATAVHPRAASPSYRSSASGFAVLAAGLALIAYAALETTRWFSTTEELRLPPVVASVPEAPPSPLADPAFVAAVSTGMPMWPAVLMADQAPMHLANVEFRQASLR